MNRNDRKAFTLVELLVVIAIISVLAALLLPALRSAMDNARRVQCLGQMKQLYIAASTFESDQRHLPIYVRTATGSTGTNTDHPYNRVGRLTIEGVRPEGEFRDFVESYADTPVTVGTTSFWLTNWEHNNLFRCPAKVLDESYWDYTERGFSGYNEWTRHGGIQMAYLFAGFNTAATGPDLGSTDRWGHRKSALARYPSKLIHTYEPCWTWRDHSNNHRGQGLNLTTMDGAGRWVRPSACVRNPSWWGGLWASAFRTEQDNLMPRDYWVAGETGSNKFNYYDPRDQNQHGMRGDNKNKSEFDGIHRLMGYARKWE